MKKIQQVKDMCISLGTGVCTVAVCHIMSESTMQDIDPTGSSGDWRVEAAVCPVTLQSFVAPHHHQWSRQVTPALPSPFLDPSDLRNLLKVSLHKMVSIALALVGPHLPQELRQLKSVV